MDNSNMKNVKEVFGQKFQQYCINHQISLKEDKCGAFEAPNVSTLKECIDVCSTIKTTVDKRLRKLQRIKSHNTQIYTNHCTQRYHRQYMINNNKTQKFYKKETAGITEPCQRFLKNLELHINLYDTSPIAISRTPYTMKKDFILYTAKSSNDIFEFIMKSTLKSLVVTDYEDSVASICALLKEFQKRHKKFNYIKLVSQMLKTKISNEELKSKYAISKKQLKSFFNYVFAKVVPRDMFGNLRNFKIIKKAMYTLLSLPRFKSFNLMPCINAIDISKISWLQNIKNSHTQWLVIMKFITWFFNGFLIKILRINFHVTSVSAISNEKVYIPRYHWCSIQKKYINKKIRLNVLQPSIACNNGNLPIGMYKLYPKRSGIRPIFISDYKQEHKNDLHIMLKFLRQSYITKYGLINFEEKWKSIIEHRNSSHSKKLYLVSSDVNNAFGSIIQDRLYDIILWLCENLPEDLAYRYYWIRSKHSFDDVCFKQYFCNTNLQLPFHRGTLYARKNQYTKWIKKSVILTKIREYIFQQRVKIHRKIYIVAKGIVQGTMLSPILSDIYYNFIFYNHMARFLKSGELIRYMDDILYVTENIVIAKEFLQLTKKGVWQYNCYFKEAKTQSNINYDNVTAISNVTFIGYQINCNTLELMPQHLHREMRYLISFRQNHKSPLKIFRERMSNMSNLKLSKIILSRTVNSRAVVKTILRSACLLYAKRTHFLMKGLFHKKLIEYSFHILKIIKDNNKKFVRWIIKILLTVNEGMTNSDILIWNKQILRTLWISYRIVFKRNPILRKRFIKPYKNKKNKNAKLQ